MPSIIDMIWFSFLVYIGFYNVPTTKFLVLFIGGCSIVSAILNMKPYFHLQLVPHITIHHQVNSMSISACVCY